jgi:hypothetical protein
MANAGISPDIRMKMGAVEAAKQATKTTAFAFF